MREIDHIRHPGYLQAWRELGMRIRKREQAEAARLRAQSKIVPIAASRGVRPTLVKKRA